MDRWDCGAQGLVPLRWGCALPSPNAPGPFPAQREEQRRAEQAGRAAGARTREPPSQFKTRHEGKGP